MAGPRLAIGEQRDEAAEPADEDDQAEQPETAGPALDPGDAAEEAEANREEKAGEVAEMAVEIGRRLPPDAMNHRGPFDHPRAARQHGNDAGQRHHQLEQPPLG